MTSTFLALTLLAPTTSFVHTADTVIEAARTRIEQETQLSLEVVCRETAGHWVCSAPDPVLKGSWRTTCPAFREIQCDRPVFIKDGVF